MDKLLSYLIDYPTASFLVLTFAISLISFALMLLLPNAETPESTSGFPVWMLAIWSPNIAAIMIWLARSEFLSNFRIAFSLPSLSFWHLLAFIPLIILVCIILIKIYNGEEIQWSNFKMSYLIPLLLMHLFMGPLGEELGWRGFLYPILAEKYGWLASALIVGVIWALWHLPLWFIESPQSEIPFWAFSVNVILLSISMSMIMKYSDGSILFVVMLHLIFNVSLALVSILEIDTQGGYIKLSLYLYIPIVILLMAIHEFTKNQICEL